MGQSLSCGQPGIEQVLVAAVQSGELNVVESILQLDPGVIQRSTLCNHLSVLHIAATIGHPEILSMLLERWDQPDVLSQHKQTPLILAAMRGKMACVEKLLHAGANILMFDSIHGRTCLHYAAYYGHSDCLQAILRTAHSNQISESCCPGSTPLHLAARKGSLECVRELLAWGADRLQIDSAGELNQDVKLLLEKALMEANRKREKKILKGMVYSLPSPTHSESVDDDETEGSSIELCCICFDQACTIEVQDCRHQMCAHCTLALCCHYKPKPATQSPLAPVCPFCRSDIARLTAAKSKIKEEIEKENSPKQRRLRQSHNSSEGSSSFLSSAMGSIGRMGSHGSGRIADCSDMLDKL